MHTSAHLHFKGDCREAFRFYAEVLGGRIVFAMTYGESPAAEQTPPELRDRIIHARLDLGEQFLLGCDTPLDRYHAPQGFNVMLAVDQPVDAEGTVAGSLRLIGGGDPNLSARTIPDKPGPVTGHPLGAGGELADNGTVTMPFQETFWAKRFGMCTDRFGIPWMVNCAKPPEAVSGSGRRSAA